MNVLGNNKVDVIQGFVCLVDAHTIEVNGEKITADNILIATEAVHSGQTFQGAEYGINPDGFFELSALPNVLLLWVLAILLLN